MNIDQMQTDVALPRKTWCVSGCIFGRRWSLTPWRRHRARPSTLCEGMETDQGKKWQARLWVRRDEAQEGTQEVIFYGRSLHALRLSAHEWLAHEQPMWFSNVPPTEKLNRARSMQQVVVQRRLAQPRGIAQPRVKLRSSVDWARANKEPEITAEMVQRYPLVFPEQKAAPTPTLSSDELPEAPASACEAEGSLYWSREEAGARRERTAVTAGPNQFDRFEDAVLFFLWHDLLPERGPDFHEEVFSSDVTCYTSVRSIHEEDNELLINDYLSRGWFYNGQVRGKVAPHHATGDGPLIVLLYHREPHAR